LILGALGVTLGHISPQTMGLITLVGVVTIFASTYMILYSHNLYQLFATPLKLFERKNPYRETSSNTAIETTAADAILVGLGNYGSGLAERLLERKMKIIGVDFDPQVLERWRARGVSVLYGDMADPDLYERLPMNRVRWVVSTVRSKDVNLALLHLLRQRGYDAKVALTAASEEEATLYRHAGAHVVLRPFVDAAEQGADALTDATDILPEGVDWPVAFQEIRVKSGSLFAGQSLRNIPLRSSAGASVLAVSRAGRVHYDPEPDFQVYPGDHVILMGSPRTLKDADVLINKTENIEAANRLERFVIVELEVFTDSKWLGKTLADLQFRQRCGVTVVGIRRGQERITSPGPNESLHAGDRLIVIGTSDKISQLKCGVSA
jgi:Trk K+ transport system NAD-binding subunit